jgi:flagellar assembly protein FliH
MAAIIKASGALPSAADSATRAFQFDDMGDAYLGRVRSEAAKIIAEARSEAVRLKAKATEEGKQAAIKAVEASLRSRLDQQLQSALRAVEAAAKAISDARHSWQQHWERHAVHLAAAIAGRLCRRELGRDPEITLQWIREALDLAAGSEQISLRLNPEDHTALGSRIEDVIKQLAAVGAVRVVSDPSITAGGCRIDTAFGSLDQQLATQLDRIAAELLE